MHGELWRTGWQAHEDAIPQHMSPAYFDPHIFGAMPQEFQFPYNFDDRLRKKARGVSDWTANGPAEAPSRQSILDCSHASTDPWRVRCASIPQASKRGENRRAVAQKGVHASDLTD
jgi:hypothetical protein